MTRTRFAFLADNSAYPDTPKSFHTSAFARTKWINLFCRNETAIPPRIKAKMRNTTKVGGYFHYLDLLCFPAKRTAFEATMTYP